MSDKPMSEAARKLWNDLRLCYPSPNLTTELALIQAALDAAEQRVLDDLLGTDPCPKCGSGVSAGCYGCRVIELEKQLAEAKAALDAARA